ncbi:MAG: hypothetical protein JWQ14_710 [Adhaeribacter sp.]|nr:hypothetical protein [Adhaeribacter sp.]
MAAAEPDNFFTQKRTIGEIKDKILPQYFKIWCESYLKEAVSPSDQPLDFFDLQAGEGFTPEGQPTSPITILNSMYQPAAFEGDGQQQVNICFTDSSDKVVEKLKINLEQLPYYPALSPLPVVSTQSALLELWAGSEAGQRPTLLFLNPASQALSRQILMQALPQAQTDILMIFSVNKMRSALLPDDAADAMNGFWGERWEEIQQINRTENNIQRKELRFMQALEGVFRENGFNIFKFNIKATGKNAASQYLFLATKSIENYLGMKEIMQAYSQYQEDGVPLFEASSKALAPLLPGFFSYLHPFCIANLAEDLAGSKSRFHYKTLQAIYEEHSIGTNYIKANYKVALEKLHAQGYLYPVDAQNKKVKAITDTSVIFYNLHRPKNK